MTAEEVGGGGQQDLDLSDVSSGEDPRDIPQAELVEEWREIAKALDSGEYRIPHDDEEEWYDRRRDLWDELESRHPEDAPPCPECGSKRWGQNPGEPKYCRYCGVEVGPGRIPKWEGLNEAIDEYWDGVTSVPEDGEA